MATIHDSLIRAGFGKPQPETPPLALYYWFLEENKFIVWHGEVFNVDDKEPFDIEWGGPDKDNPDLMEYKTRHEADLSPNKPGETTNRISFKAVNRISFTAVNRISFIAVLKNVLGEWEGRVIKFIRKSRYSPHGIYTNLVKYLLQDINELKLENSQHPETSKYPEIIDSLERLENIIKEKHLPSISIEADKAVSSALHPAFIFTGEGKEALEGLHDLFDKLISPRSRFKFLSPYTNWADFKEVFLGKDTYTELDWVWVSPDLVEDQLSGFVL